MVLPGRMARAVVCHLSVLSFSSRRARLAQRAALLEILLLIQLSEHHTLARTRLEKHYLWQRFSGMFSDLEELDLVRPENSFHIRFTSDSSPSFHFWRGGELFILAGMTVVLQILVIKSRFRLTGRGACFTSKILLRYNWVYWWFKNYRLPNIRLKAIFY